MEQTKTQMELTIEELVALIKAQEGDFLVSVQHGEEAAGNGETPSKFSG